MEKLIIKSLSKSKHRNQYSFEHKKDSIKIIIKILNELGFKGYAIPNSWFVIKKDKTITNKIKPKKDFIGEHVYINDGDCLPPPIKIDIIFTEKTIYMLMYTEKDLQKQISNAIMKFSKIKEIK